MIRIASSFVFMLLALLLVPTRAWAGEDPATVDLSVGECLRSSESSLREILSIEVETLAETDAQTQGADLETWAGCEGDQIVLRVIRLDTDEVLEERLIGVEPTGPGASRAVALAMTELIGLARPPPPPAPYSPERWLRAAGLATYRPSVAGGAHLGGLTGRAEVLVTRLLRLVGGLQWVMGGADAALGRILATSLTASAALSLGEELQSETYLGVALGLRAGAVRWNGRSNQVGVRGPRDWGPFLGLLVRPVADIPLSSRVGLRVAAEIGAILVGSRAVAVDETGGAPMVLDTVSLEDWWLATSLGVSFAF